MFNDYFSGKRNDGTHKDDVIKEVRKIITKAVNMLNENVIDNDLFVVED